MSAVTTPVENLLRVARDETAAGTAFAAILAGGRALEIVSVPAPEVPEGLSSDELAQLVDRAAADPEFARARAFVRAVQLGHALTLAVAPVGDGAGRSMIGVVAGPDHRFEPAQLGVLERLAQRLLRHLEAVQRVGGGAWRGEELPGRAVGRGEELPGRVIGRTEELPPRVVGRGEEHGSDEPRRGQVPGSDEPPQAAEQPSRPASALREAPLEMPPATWWAAPQPLLGLSSLGQFFSRAGRMLASDTCTAGALALVVVEVPDPRTAPSAARALRAQLRFADPLALVDCDLLAAAVVIYPAGSGGAVEQRLGSAVRSALEGPGSVRTVHVVATPGDRREVDEILRDAVRRLPGRS